jgi:hypothetical protein
MFCVNGFATDDSGCQVCKCRSKPKAQCTSAASSVADSCEYGQRFDENGCLTATAQCLPNPCLQYGKCPDGKVCEPFRVRNCPECPATARCIDVDFVQRVKISLGYRLSSHRINEEELKEEFVKSMCKLLGVDDDLIQGVTLETTTPGQIIVTCQLVPAVDSDPSSQIDIMMSKLQDDTSGYSLTVGRVQVTPDVASINVVYYSDSYVDASDTGEKKKADGAIIVLFVVGSIAAVFVVFFLTKVIRRKRQKKARMTAEYQKTPQSDLSADACRT